MICGGCPYEGCDGYHMISIAPKCPAFSHETCETCGRKFWLLHSRIDPDAFTEEEFAEKYEILPDGSVKDKNPPKPWPDDPLHNAVRDAFLKAYTNLLLYGDSSGEQKGRTVPKGILGGGE